MSICLKHYLLDVTVLTILPDSWPQCTRYLFRGTCTPAISKTSTSYTSFYLEYCFIRLYDGSFSRRQRSYLWFSIKHALPSRYYDTCLFVIIFIEHYGFRGGNFSNYDLEGWNTPSRLPIGFAGGLAFLCGWAGAILGMDETLYDSHCPFEYLCWRLLSYIGYLAAKIGDYGGDIGNQLAFVFTIVSFYPLRWLELKYTGRWELSGILKRRSTLAFFLHRNKMLYYLQKQNTRDFNIT